MEQPCQIKNDFLGEAKDWDENADWATISNGSRNKTDEIRNESERLTVNGVLSESAVADKVSKWCSDQEPVHKMGWTTGHTEGCLTEDHVTISDWALVDAWGGTCSSLEGEGIEVNIYGAQGDSGGPIYERNSGWVYLVTNVSMGNVTDQKICGDRKEFDYLYGCAAYHMRNQYNITFDTNI